MRSRFVAVIFPSIQMIRVAIFAVLVACTTAADLLSSASGSHLLRTLSSYEVVSVNSHSPADSLLHASAHPSSVTIDMTVNNMKISSKLDLNTKLFAKGYEAKRIRNGVEELLPPPELCHYHGSVTSDSESTGPQFAALSSCSHNAPSSALSLSKPSFSGLIAVGGQMLGVEPAHAHLSPLQLHHAATQVADKHNSLLRAQSPSAAVLSASDVDIASLHVVYDLAQLSDEGSCGVDHSQTDEAAAEATDAKTGGHTVTLGEHAHDHSHQHSPLAEILESLKNTNTNTNTNTPTSSSPSTQATEKFIEIFIANDQRRYQQESEDTETKTATIFNIVAGLYANNNFDPALTLTLIGQDTYVVNDPYEITHNDVSCDTCGDGEVRAMLLLSQFSEYSNNANYKGDVNQLFTGFDLNGSVLGVAYVDAGCTATASGVIQATSTSTSYVATIAAHELGHSLSARHTGEDNTCATSGFIMSASIGSPLATQFSSCSKTSINAYTSSKTCFDNDPTTTTCGNGIVEAGEQCDCGNSISCLSSDPCCNASTCQYSSGSACASNDSCCDTTTCQPQPQGYQCRAAVSDCDVAEVCDGSAVTCPSDLIKGNGRDCVDSTYGPGSCWRGQCMSQKKQCKIDGDTFSGAPYDVCTSNDATNDEDFCAVARCSRSGSGCTSFPSTNSVTVRTSTGIRCGSQNFCYEGYCRDAAAYNNQYNAFQYSYTPWENCFACDEVQTRDYTCVDGESSEVDEVLCGPEPFVARMCINETIGCNGGAGVGVSVVGAVLVLVLTWVMA
jgi:hypothetical protein